MRENAKGSVYREVDSGERTFGAATPVENGFASLSSLHPAVEHDARQVILEGNRDRVEGMNWQKLVPELTVSDFASSLDFYTTLLGFDVLFTREDDHSPIWNSRRSS
jgi:hypothetical protein